MKNSQEEQKNSFDEYEDLTLFADESFDTGDVDLFEFSSEDDSILTRLKSIILSLDWEINDEILQELTDELQVLQGHWQDDKVAEVYLQGLDKIGRYIRSKGAYAHHNAIKLLLTFYYNFEKITSSEKITEEEISLLLKGDVRKFRILQYQVNQEDEPGPGTIIEEPVLLQADVEEKQAVHHAEDDHLKLLKASILSLDWEVTEDSLQQLSSQLDYFHQVLAGDKPAMVLVQGLSALGDYISESGAAAHPESFTLLHAFSEGLDQVLHVDPDKRDKQQLQTLLVDRIGRLNALKALIIEQPSPPSEKLIDGLVEEMAVTEQPPEVTSEDSTAEALQEFTAAKESEDAEEFPGDIEAELDDLFPVDNAPAMETSSQKYPDEVLPPDAIHPISDDVADEYIETELRTKRDFAPALSGSDEVFGFNEDTEPLDVPAQSDLNDQLDKLFDNDIFGDDAAEEDEEKVTANEGEPVPALADEVPLDVALANFDFTTDEEDSIAPNEQELDLDIESKLDTFFSDKETSTDEAELPLHQKEVDSGITPALSGSSDEQGFSIEESMESLPKAPLGDIEEKLDFFFDEKDDEASLLETNFSDADENFEDTLDIFGSDDTKNERLDSSLDFAPATANNIDSLQQDSQENELEEQLDFFFDASEDDEDEPGLELSTPLPAFAAPVKEEEGEERTSNATEDKEVYLAALGAVLPSTVRAPTDEGIAEAAKLLTQLKNIEQESEEKVIGRLMGAIIDQLVHSRFIDLAETEKVINLLFEQMNRPSVSTEDMTDAIEQYLGWQAGVVATIAKSTKPGLVLPSATSPAASDKVVPAPSEPSELSLIKNMIQDEFNQLRDELKKEN